MGDVQRRVQRWVAGAGCIVPFDVSFGGSSGCPNLPTEQVFVWGSPQPGIISANYLDLSLYGTC